MVVVRMVVILLILDRPIARPGQASVFAGFFDIYRTPPENLTQLRNNAGMTVAIFYDKRMLDHVAGPIHPERPGRLKRILEALQDLPEGAVTWNQPGEPDVELLAHTHHPRHVEKLLSLRGATTQLDPDTPVSPSTINAALLSTACAVGAVDAVMTGKHPYAFSLGRPPGHHATPNRAMGFCFFNNAGVAAVHAQRKYNLERVMIIDWDVHHGNGTQDIFEASDQVLFLSTHQSPWYPGTGMIDEIGTGAGRGFTVNLPFPAGFDDAAVFSAYKRIVAPVITQFAPQLLVMSAGFDMHKEDPLGALNVTEHGFAALTRLMMTTSANINAKLVFALEGGYSLRSLGASVRAVIDELAGLAVTENITGEIDPAHARLIDTQARKHQRIWSQVAV